MAYAAHVLGVHYMDVVADMWIITPEELAPAVARWLDKLEKIKLARKPHLEVAE